MNMNDSRQFFPQQPRQPLILPQSQQLPPPPLSQPPLKPPPPPPELTVLQKLQAQLNQSIRYFTQEQIRLYFFPFPERQYKELWKRLMRWFMYLGGLFVLLIVIYVALVGSQQGLTATGLFGGLLSFSLIVLIFWLAFKYVVPLWKLYRFEYKEHMKEQQHLAQHRPPTDQEYREWIYYLGSVIYDMAEEKLHLPESKVHKDWREWKEKTGEENGPRPRKRREYDADLRIKGVEHPSGERNYILRQTKQDKQDVVLVTSKEELDHSQALRRGGNYSINSFTRLFVTKDFITIYSNTINVRQPERVQEKSEHFYHQHLTYVSMRVDGSKIGNDMVMIQELTLMLDSGHTIPLNVASAIFSYKKNGHRSEVSDVDSVHGGLIRALHEHKISVLESNVEADKAKEAFPEIEDDAGMQY
jgi:uncharacterized membrane protein (DUF485 family)